MAIRSYSRIRVWCCLILVLARLQTVCPFTNFVDQNTELPAKENNKFVDRLFVSLNDKIKFDEKMKYFSDMVSFYFKSFQEQILNNSNVSATNSNVNVSNAGESNFGGFFNIEDFGLHTVIIAMVLGANIGFLGNSLFHLCTKDFTFISCCTMLITSALPLSIYSYQDKLISALKISGKTLSDQISSNLELEKEATTIMTPTPPNDPLMQKVLKMLFPGYIMKNSTFSFRKCLRLILEKSGINLSTLLTAITLAFVTNQIVLDIYNFFNEETFKEDFTDEELLEDYKDNEELYRTFEDWLTPRRRSINDSEYNDVSVV